MAEYTQRSLLRNVHGPTIIDGGSVKTTSSTARRTHRSEDKDGRDHHQSKRQPPPPSTPTPQNDRKTDRRNKKSHHHRHTRRISDPTNPPSLTMASEPLSFTMDIIEPPPRSLVLGTSLSTSIIISLRLPSPDQPPASTAIDTTRLLAVASLVTDTRSGDRIPIEAGMLTGQKMFDSVHAIPAECASPLARSHPCRLALGYFSFPGLLIRQAGCYRVRVTLIKMGASGAGGGASVLAVDSEVIRVERRGVRVDGRVRG